jgi:biopolymer transport protein ExbB/TolQ
MMTHEIVDHTAQVLDLFGAAWILYLLMFMSVFLVAIAVERLLFLRRNRVPVEKLQQPLLKAMDEGREAVEKLLAPYSGMAAQVALAGVAELHRGSASVEEVMGAREAAESKRYDQRLAWLGTIGSNAPFVGLLGTVIGIMGAFSDLQLATGAAAATANQAIMSSISEALVATAIGLFVAIPAVVAFNYLRTRVKEAQSDTRVLAGIVLAWTKQEAPRGDANSQSFRRVA